MKLWNMNASYDDSEFEMAPDRATNALEEVVRLANLQEERVLATWAAERKSGLINPHLDTMIRIQKELLLSIPELLFDLGMEDCKRHTPWEHIATVERRRADADAKCAENLKTLEKLLGPRPEANALNGRATNLDTCPPADLGSHSRAEAIAAVSSNEDVQAASVLEKLVNLADIQDQRVLALSAEENKSEMTNPRLDNAIKLHHNLLVSVQALMFDLGLEKYARRTPREQVAEYWEQEQRNDRSLQEALIAAKKCLDQHFGNLPGGQVPAHNDVHK
jgi:hypothetical protein